MSQEAGKSVPPVEEPLSSAADFSDSGTPSGPDATEGSTGTDADSPGTPEQADGARSFGGFFAPDLPEGRRLFLWFFLAMLLFSLYLLFSLLQPFLHSIILACVFTAICHPLYQSCLRLTGNRRVPAALIALFAIALLLTVLIVVFVAGLIPQAKTTIAAVNQWLGGAHLGETLNVYIEPLLQTIQMHFPEFEISIKDIRDNLTTLSTRAGQHLLGYAYAFVGNTLLFFAHTLLVLLIMFFLFIDGGALVDRISYLFPMKAEQTAVMIESLRRMSRAVLVGGFSVAVLQGIAGGIGLALVGIPALFWGAVMAFAALVPVVGTGLVWGPAVVFLLIMGRWKSALFLALWCGIGVTSIDSFLRPYLLRGGAKVPVLFLFMAILGGVDVFGMLGILYGPMILGLVAVMLDIYAEEYHDILQKRFRSRP